jgi:anti-sigma regulatory factor (Ser/Thr protein kinase)
MTPAGTAGTLRWAVLDVPALPEHVRTARNLVATTLGNGHPCAADAVLLASELVTNSVRHSGSRRPGGTVTITIWGDTSSVLIEVTDAGGQSVPAVHHGSDQEGGRGLFLVEQLSASGATGPMRTADASPGSSSPEYPGGCLSAPCPCLYSIDRNISKGDVPMAEDCTRKRLLAIDVLLEEPEDLSDGLEAELYALRDKLHLIVLGGS